MKCQTCKREMTEAEDCGGDCVFCMAEAGDTDCALRAYEMMKVQRDELLAALETYASMSEAMSRPAREAIAKVKP